jgi:hypothetical protein
MNYFKTELVIFQQLTNRKIEYTQIDVNKMFLADPILYQLSDNRNNKLIIKKV